MIKYFIYGLCDPKTDEIRYVGLTGDGMRRPWSHWSSSIKNTLDGKWECNYHVHRWLRKNDSKPHIIIIEECPQSIINLGIKHIEYWLNATEILYIAYYRGLGLKLTNMTAGGGGTLGRSPWNKGKTDMYTPEVIASMSKPKSAETKIKMAIAQKGRIVSVETRTQIATTLKGKFTGIRACHRRTIRCLNDGKIFPTLTSTAQFYGLSISSICKSAKLNIRLKYSNLKFEYINDIRYT